MKDRFSYVQVAPYKGLTLYVSSFIHPKDRCVLHCPVDVFDGANDIEHDLDGNAVICFFPFQEVGVYYFAYIH